MPHAARCYGMFSLLDYPGPRAVSGDEQVFRVQIRVFGEPAQRRDAPGSMETSSAQSSRGSRCGYAAGALARVGASSPAIGMVLALGTPK